ncbi:CMRF35-like molecule 8 [Microcaecilia unicolor]|uniref:CMRF35-like molecule 8 n=1 Tax=Microcaecilia unicolor TaxID=1415580 RepID=A0A6P7XAU4_9AMPH|nr:CMRF35-like molecule 8 [Microcaecilia unicolor]
MLMRIFPVWSLMILCPGGSWGLRGPREVKSFLGGSLSLQCQYNEYYKNNKKYWCRGETSCEKLIETEPNSFVTMDRLSISDNNAVLTFRVTMEQLSNTNSGAYECGINKYGIDLLHRVYVTVLPVDLRFQTYSREETGFVGESLSLTCWYGRDDKTEVKYWCRGDRWRSCDILADTEFIKNDRISITDNQTALEFTVTMKNVTAADSGTYWCGIKETWWDSGHPVKVTILSGSSTLTPAVTSMTTGPQITATAEMGPTLSTPHRDLDNIFYILTAVILLLLSLIALATVILIRRWRRKKALKGEMSKDNENNFYHEPPPDDTAISALYSVPRKPTSTGSDNLYANVASLQVSGMLESCYDEVQSQCTIIPKGGEDVYYSNVRFSVNPNLEHTANTGPPHANSSTEVTYAVIKTH